MNQIDLFATHTKAIAVVKYAIRINTENIEMTKWMVHAHWNKWTKKCAEQRRNMLAKTKEQIDGFGLEHKLF